MAQKPLGRQFNRDMINAIESMFTELYSEYTRAGLDAAEAKEKAIQAVADALYAKETAETTRDELTRIIREQTEGGDVVPEVVQARGNEETLGNRLNSISQDLAQTFEDLLGRGANALSNGVTGNNVTDDTQAIRDLIQNNTISIIPVPPVKYRITDEIVIPSNRKVIFIGGNHWNPNQQRNVTFIYDGEEALDKAMFRVSQSPIGPEPTTATSNVMFIGGVQLDGNNKIGYGFYGAYITNDSQVEGITAINTLVDGIRIEKSWYARYENLIAKSNMGNGITIGKNGWGGVNGCKIGNLRAHGNGINREFTENNIIGYGVGLFLGSGSTVENIVSEMNYGPGLYYGLGGVNSIHVRDVYLEKNGIGAFDDGKTNRKWGIIVEGGLTGQAKTLRNVFLASGENAQDIWLRGENGGQLLIDEIAGGGILRSDFENYSIGNISGNLSTNIQGHFPFFGMRSTPHSNWSTLYVNQTGNDKNNGRTETTPLRTLQKALALAKVIPTIKMIVVSSLMEVTVNLDFKDLTQDITIDGSGTSQITGTTTLTGLTITDARNKVTIRNFRKIDRVIGVRSNNVHLLNSPLGHRDSSFNGTLELDDTVILVEGCPMDGSAATGSTKNGIRIRGGKVTILNPSLTGYSIPVSISKGGCLVSDKYVAQFGSVVAWPDGSGYLIAGNRLKTSAGALIIPSE